MVTDFADNFWSDLGPNLSQGFVKDLFDVSDNLERAASVVPPGTLAQEESTATPEQLKAMLRGLVQGVSATEQIMMQVCVWSKVTHSHRAHRSFVQMKISRVQFFAEWLGEAGLGEHFMM